MDFSIVKQSHLKLHNNFSDDEDNDLVGELENVLKSLKEGPEILEENKVSEGYADVIRLMERLNELDSDAMPNHSDYNSVPAPRK